MTMRFSVLLPLLLALAGDLSSQVPAKALTQIDSVILVRTGCLGDCPAYRLSVPANGRILFVSQHASDASRSLTQPTTNAMLQRIERVLADEHFASLPEMHVGIGPYCRVIRTDHPSISVTLYRERLRISRSYNLGCGGDGTTDGSPLPYLRSLSAIADSIDAIAAKAEWIRPDGKAPP